jgi:hypothetical protein
MKPLNAPVKVVSHKARAHASKTYRQRFTIEQSDVGTKRERYLGSHQGPKEITQQDVGRDIEVITDSNGWVSWSFCAGSR